MSVNLLNGFSPLYQLTESFLYFVLSVLSIVGLLVGCIIVFLRYIGWTYRDLLENDKMESVWTYVPGIVIGIMSIPSFYGLYQSCQIAALPKQTVKVVGHQWFWHYVESFYVYTYTNHIVRRCRGIICGLKDMFMWRQRRDTSTKNSHCEMKTFDFTSHWVPDSAGRNINVDKPLILFARVYTRFLISAYDVAHSFAIPQVGLKIDAIPGRVNQGYFYSLRAGKFVGQCSEVCGANHTFMPIVVECVDSLKFKGYVDGKFFEFNTDGGLCDLHNVTHSNVLYKFNTTYEHLNY